MFKKINGKFAAISPQKRYAAATKGALGVLGFAMFTVAGSANALVAAVTGGMDETVLLGIGAVVMTAVGIILLIRSGKKAGS